MLRPVTQIIDNRFIWFLVAALSRWYTLKDQTRSVALLVPPSSSLG